jgi:ABC-type Fe3+-siderophore transport system permease subunit
MDAILFIVQWVNIISILAALVFLLFSTKRYQGVIGGALMYLSVGIVISALISVADLLTRTVDFNSFQRIGGYSWEDVIHSSSVTFAFLMIAVGFYKLSRIYKRL